jgi:hypothetical protein
MLLSLLAAAAVQAAPAPEKPAPDVKRQLACPTGKSLPVKALRPGLNSLHKLGDEPDAHMIRPVARNYCNEADIVRFNVTGDQPKAPQPPISDILRPGTLQPAGR